MTYTPPASVPAAPNNQPTLTATSVADNTKSGADIFAISSSVANSCGTAGGAESLLNGHYALLMEGFAGSGAGTPLLVGASFVANGSGGVTGGEEDVNDTIAPQHLAFASGASSGSLYTVGSDHRGCLQLTNSAGTTTVFRFALNGINSGVASAGSLIEFDDNSGTAKGSRGSGILRRQDPNSFVLSALKSQYAFGVDGWNTSNNQFRFSAAGSFNNSNGVLTNGVDDLNFTGVTSLDTTGLTSGSHPMDPISATTGRTACSFDIFDWAIYVVNSSEFFLVGTDPLENATVSVGRAISTGGSFTASSLSGNYVAHTTGNSGTSADVNLELLTMTPGGAQTGTLSGTVYSDGGGNGAATTSLSNVAYNIDPSLGRVVLGNPSDNLPVLYVTTPTDGISAFVVGVNADAQQGVIEFQPSQTYSTASVAGTFAFGTEDPGDNTVYNKVGSATISTSGSASGTVDSSATAGLTPGVPFNPTVTITDSNGTGNLGSQTVAITNGTKIFYIDRKCRGDRGGRTDRAFSSGRPFSRKRPACFCELFLSNLKLAEAVTSSRPLLRSGVRGSIVLRLQPETSLGRMTPSVKTSAAETPSPSMAEIFGPGGMIEKCMPAGYEHRRSQLCMAELVEDAFRKKRHLLVEAGTGTGKTLAYLVPAIRSGRRVVISTATKSLQEQLFTKDVPFVQKHFAPDLKVAVMKGRANFLCRHKVHQMEGQPVLKGLEELDWFGQIRDWERLTETGDRAELSFLPDDADLWTRLDARREACTGQKCVEFERCFVTAMHRRAQDADVIIVNHHLFFADLALRQDDFGSILPEYSAVIFDEAHEIEDVASDYFGRQVSNYRFEELARDAEQAMRLTQLGKPPLLRRVSRLREKTHDFFGLTASAGRALRV